LLSMIRFWFDWERECLGRPAPLPLSQSCLPRRTAGAAAINPNRLKRPQHSPLKRADGPSLRPFLLSLSLSPNPHPPPHPPPPAAYTPYTRMASTSTQTQEPELLDNPSFILRGSVSLASRTHYPARVSRGGRLYLTRSRPSLARCGLQARQLAAELRRTPHREDGLLEGVPHAPVPVPRSPVNLSFPAHPTLPRSSSHAPSETDRAPPSYGSALAYQDSRHLLCRHGA
jgi:hypothetical protein